ncbi:MAG TPA: hypothetical protein VEB21_16830 [Terriglobales bacterium]|nr:hypothetical protein [Terriglobales bacterium]
MISLNLYDRRSGATPGRIAMILAGGGTGLVLAALAAAHVQLYAERDAAREQVAALEVAIAAARQAGGEEESLLRARDELQAGAVRAERERSRLPAVACQLLALARLLPGEVVLSAIASASGTWTLEGTSRSPSALTALLARLPQGGFAVEAVTVGDGSTAAQPLQFKLDLRFG